MLQPNISDLILVSFDVTINNQMVMVSTIFRLRNVARHLTKKSVSTVKIQFILERVDIYP